MSYSIFRATKRWTPLNTISKSGPKHRHRAEKHTLGKAAISIAIEKKKYHQLMDELCASETDVVVFCEENANAAQRLAEKKAAEKEEVAKANLKEAARDDDSDDECHYGLFMCMSF